MSARPVVVIGSLNADLVVTVDRFPAPSETLTGRDFATFPGGKGANQAVAAGRLGGTVRMVGRVGRDVFGGVLRESLAAAGVDTRGIREDAEAPTGTALITIDAAGQNQIVVVPGANGRLSVADVEAAGAAFEGAAVVLLQLEVPLDVVAAAAAMGRRAGALVILDPAPARPDALALVGGVDVITPNETELRTLTAGDGVPAEGDEIRARVNALRRRGARRVVAKLGPRGALEVTDQGEQAWPAIAVTPVDTTAAGDVWNGAYACALAEGRASMDAGAFATAAATLSVTRHGAQPSMPTRPEVEAFLQRR